MVEGLTPIEGHPDIILRQSIDGSPDTRLNQPLTAIEPLTDLTHIRRHWEERELGSKFTPNTAFETPEEMVRLLEDVADRLIDPAEYDRSHTFTILCLDSIVGNVGIVELSPVEGYITQTRDQGGPGEAEVKVVPRTAKPTTELLTFEVRPIYPPKGQKRGQLKYQISAAFPGEPTPRAITRRRQEKYGEDPSKDPTFDEDEEFWKNHAFIVETDMPGLWMREHNLPLPQASDVYEADRARTEEYRSDYLIVTDASQDSDDVVACLSLSGWYDLYADVGAQYDKNAIRWGIVDHMRKKYGIDVHQDEVRLSDSQMKKLGLDVLEVDDLSVLTGKDKSAYELKDDEPDNPEEEY